MDFTQDPRMFIDEDTEIAIELKQFRDRRTKQIEDRAKMGQAHIDSITDEQAEAAGVSKREFGLIKKLMELDHDIFSAKDATTLQSSPYLNTVDLSKFEGKTISQDCKEILFRPQKMRHLYEQYWALASPIDIETKDHHTRLSSTKWYQRTINKTDDEY